MVVVSDLRIDPRVEREARALAGAGFDIVVIWPDLTAKPPAQLDWGSGITFRTLSPEYGHFASRFPGFLGHEMTKVAIEYRPFAYHAHDLSTALIGLAAARATGAHLVCDFHEWYSENVTWSSARERYIPHPRHVRFAHRVLERLVFKHASAVVTVCDSLSDEMKAVVGGGTRTAHVIRNIPDMKAVATRTYLPLKEELGLSPDAFLVLYQGGIGPSRMLEPIIEALPLAKECVLAIRGPGIEHYGSTYRKLAEKVGASSQLILLPAVPSRDVVDAARGADAGIYTVLDVCKNFRYALPNKIFEYLAAGLPILSAHFPEPKRIIDQFQVGVTFNPRAPRSIAAALNSLASDRSQTLQMAARTKDALRSMNADAEWEKLVAIYEGLRNEAGATAHPNASLAPAAR